MITTEPEADPFDAHRRLLFATAYRMLGAVGDAEDIVQDTWLAWSKADRSEVRHPKAYLVRTVTNLSLNRLTSARATREEYVGPWLPEPLLTAPDVAREHERAEEVSMAMLVVLESLTPVERVVFVLREAFGYSHAEIAGFLHRPEPTVRQIAHRARKHVADRRTVHDTDAARREEVTARFLSACAGGDLNAVLELLAPDVTAWSDGGGKVSSARRPLYGADHVGRFLIGVTAKAVRDAAGALPVPAPAVINGELGIRILAGDIPVGAITYDLEDGLMRNLRFHVNPDKLSGLRT
ncbi:RNA polymerase sigma factor SigJ [Streptomyces lavendulae]|uniref:RNA polymerase sigma factor SigJ n=1 Tax=Streptomyces lavendulae TaxID=1914 RepID=UPI0033E1F264